MTPCILYLHLVPRVLVQKVMQDCIINGMGAISRYYVDLLGQPSIQVGLLSGTILGMPYGKVGVGLV